LERLVIRFGEDLGQIDAFNKPRRFGGERLAEAQRRPHDAQQHRAGGDLE
jgi:hypothetical protein